MNICGIRPEHLATVFPSAVPWLTKVPLLNERYGMDEVYAKIEAEDWQLWLFVGDAVHGALLTMIVQYPKRRELMLLGVAGERMAEWISLISYIEDYAKQNDCAAVTMGAVRKGFRKMLPEYATSRVYLEKRL